MTHDPMVTLETGFLALELALCAALDRVQAERQARQKRHRRQKPPALPPRPVWGTYRPATGVTPLWEFLGDADADPTARFVQEYADFLEAHLEAWTVTRHGTLVPGINRHFIRINPVDLTHPDADADPDRATVALRNRPPGGGAVAPRPARRAACPAGRHCPRAHAQRDGRAARRGAQR